MIRSKWIANRNMRSFVSERYPILSKHVCLLLNFSRQGVRGLETAKANKCEFQNLLANLKFDVNSFQLYSSVVSKNEKKK